jgi:hypothetical protein
MSADDGRTIELRIRISRRGGEAAGCDASASKACGQPATSFHAAVYNTFNIQRHLVSAKTHRASL